jgi:hypothetical protein
LKNGKDESFEDLRILNLSANIRKVFPIALCAVKNLGQSHKNILPASMLALPTNTVQLSIVRSKVLSDVWKDMTPCGEP